MPEHIPNFPVAEALAADLAGAQVDPNEAQKTLAYLRGNPGNGRALFEYLDTVVGYGDAVIRSGRTIAYYRDLQAACRRHLRPLEDDYPTLLRTFAWSLRLLRYYRTVPDAAQEKAASYVPKPEPPLRPAGPQLPEVGQKETYKILEVDEESGVALEITGFKPDKALGVIKAENVGGKRFRPGNTARVEVIGLRTLKSGRVIVELRPTAREQA